jgi:hypothetical protein
VRDRPSNDNEDRKALIFLGALRGVMIKQIQAALNNSGNFSKSDLERFKIILQRYVSGAIGIDDTYYDLLDSDAARTRKSRILSKTKIS